MKTICPRLWWARYDQGGACKMKNWRGFSALAGMLFMLFSSQVLALNLNDKFSIDGIMAGAYQHQSLSDAPGYEDTGRGGFLFQPSLHFKLTDKDAVFVKFGFGAGDGLTDGTSPFNLNPWSVDLESSVKGINGRNRDYLLTAGYWHQIDLGAGGNLGLEGGIIDATAYLDHNAYANGGLNQFMNTALVSGPNVFMPSYDLGGAAQWEKNAFSAGLVMMNVAENVDGGNYNYIGTQFGYNLQIDLGEGHYRIIVNKTTDDFNGPDGAADNSKASFLTSCDQELGDVLGVWFRLGWQDDDTYINYKNLFSGGVDIKGSPWGRDYDNIGIGYAYLDDGNRAIDKSEVVELYYRLVLNDYAAVTLDCQYMEDKYTSGFNPSGLISGMRFTAAF